MKIATGSTKTKRVSVYFLVVSCVFFFFFHPCLISVSHIISGQALSVVHTQVAACVIGFAPVISRPTHQCAAKLKRSGITCSLVF
jgi:hypothetical protein